MRIFLLLFIFSSMSIGVTAQSFIGLKGGINFSGLDTDSNFGFQVKFGWHGGIIGKTYMGDLGYFLQSEILYQNQGNQNHSIDYLKIPAMAGFDFSDDLNVHIGLYYAHQLSKNPNFMNSDWGGVLGMDFYTSKKFITTLRLDYGFKNIVSDDANVNFFKARNAVIDISLIYMFTK